MELKNTKILDYKDGAYGVVSPEILLLLDKYKPQKNRINWIEDDLTLTNQDRASLRKRAPNKVQHGINFKLKYSLINWQTYFINWSIE